MLKKARLIISVFFVLFGYIAYEDLKPPGKIGPYLDGAFPSQVPGVGGSWDLVDPIPNVSIKSPVRIVSFANTDDVLILSKAGELTRLSVEDQTAEVILDIGSRTFKLGDCGSVGVAVHPKFDIDIDSEFNKVFIYYKTKPEPEEWSEMGFNRLSSFEWDSQKQKFDEDSENILIQQYDRSPWHDSGAMFFGEDGMLYISVGDEGAEEYQPESTQRLDGGFFGGILRIDIDNDPSRSHPIIRQPLANADPASGWWETFSQGYSIPNDNPWLSPNGEHLEEFYAIGLRSPFSMHYDDVRKKIWVADVGSEVVEEINIIDKADNCQWPYFEGDVPSEIRTKPDDFIGNEKPVYHQIERGVSSCIIGGGVYTGNKFAYLNQKYLAADFNLGKVMALTNNGVDQEPDLEVLIANISAINPEIPEKGGITGMYILNDGNIWISVMGEDYSKPGKIFQLKQKNTVEDPASKLSELGVFTDLKNLTVREGILPYDVNSPLYSDNALKSRWMAIPNDGSFDSSTEKIDFNKERQWGFPEGSVFIKHFALEIDDEKSEIVPLETRFFIIGEDNNRYGLTYKWNDEGTDAFLLGGGTSKDFDIFLDGDYAYTQTWDFPSRDQCITCHNAAAGFVLGVKTHQLNKEFYYPHLGQSFNQLEVLSDLKMFNQQLAPVESYLRSAAITDETQTLEWRIRSYLDANCSSCHQLENVKDVFLDFNLSESKSLVQYYNFKATSHASDQGRSIIEPGDHSESELWVRDASEDNNKMPPISRNLVDQIYVDSLAKWIDNIDVNLTSNDHEFLMFPNPTSGWVIIRIDDSWELPVNIHVNTIKGRLVYQSKSEETFNYIDLNLYPKGTYFVSIISEDKRQTKKVILN